MTIPTCTRRFGVDAAHRVLEHESKCKYLHGHRWEIEITCQTKELDRLGRVIDFGAIKQIFGQWLNDNLDHNSILHVRDPLLIELGHDKAMALLGKPPYILSCNPTSENLAIHLFYMANQLLVPTGITCSRIRVYETPTCYAEYEPPTDNK